MTPSNVTYLPSRTPSEPLWGEPVRILAPVREPLLKPAQAAEALGCTIPELHGRRDVEAFCIGSRWRYRLVGTGRERVERSFKAGLEDREPDPPGSPLGKADPTTSPRKA